ncbi:hypothetical protein [Bradyrhizobium sp.]|uniref:hypothetical protein n=1 Tax=Bradyrhizobium sp. TaxID=376 RepID=UPI0040383FC9
MSEVISFGNIVNSLRAVRNDYNEHLKTVPQYEAFLLVESSTQKVADTLQGIINSAAPSMAGEVVATLELAKARFREHLTSVPEYRALLAIDKLIRDVAADLGVQPAQAAAPAEPEPTAVETASTAEVEAPVLQETVSQSEPTVQHPADEAAVAIASIAEAVSAHSDGTDTAEPAPVHAAADTATEVAQEDSGHQEATVQPPAPEYVYANEVAAQTSIEQAPPAVLVEASGHETEATAVLGGIEAPAEVAVQTAENQETASFDPGAGHAPSEPVVIIAEETSEPEPSEQPETYGHEAEKAA